MYRQSLLRIDRDPTRRRKGKYHVHDMEQEVIKRFKVRRARGRKVSPRWLTANSKSVMKEKHPHVLRVDGYNWRCRFAKRFHIGQKRKTNVKNKTWEQSEVVIVRFLTTLRKRLQLDALERYESEREQLQGNDAVESEPEDENPPREEEAVVRELPPLDSSDDQASDAGDLTTFESVLPAGMRAALRRRHRLAAAGAARVQEFGGTTVEGPAHHVQLDRPRLVAGRHPKAERRQEQACKVGLVRLPANFITFYEADQQLGPHALTLGKNGQGAVTEGERWVMLEADV